MNIEKVLDLLDISVQGKDIESIDKWKRYYEGFDKDFHEYKKSMGTGQNPKTMTRYSLGMAKTIAENWADVIYNPETLITVDDEATQSWLDETLGRLDFTTNFNNLVEMYMALGMGGTNVYSDGSLKIDFMYTEQIYPISYNNDEVAEVLFISQYDKDTLYVTVHQLNKDGGYDIQNKFIDITDKENYTFKTMEGIKEEHTSDIKLFEVFKPAIANNINVGSAEGISIYANAIDELQAVDIAFDTLVTEEENGKMMIFLKEAMLNFSEDDEGNASQPYVNNDNGIFYVMEGDSTNDEGTFIKTHAPTLRVTELTEGLKYNMNLLARKCGLGDNYFSSDEGSIYTNTAQVVSTNSKFYKTRQKHLSKVESGILGIIKALYYVENETELEHLVTIQFDDSIIHDEKTEKQNLMLELNQGLISDVYYYMETMNLTRDQALSFKKQMQEDKGLEEEIDFEEELS